MPKTPDWGGGGPYATASRVPSQPGTGSGAANRAGGSANGIPLNTTTPDSTLPRRAPAATRTFGSATVMAVSLRGCGRTLNIIRARYAEHQLNIPACGETECRTSTP